MSRDDMDKSHRQSLDPELAALDVELRRIRFRERASFAPELGRRLASASESRNPRTPGRVAPIAVAAALAIGLLQLGSGPWGAERVRPAAADRAPILLGEDAPDRRALYLAVSERGRVLRVSHLEGEHGPAGPEAAFVCAFDTRRALCGPPGVVDGPPLAMRVGRGPFIYRDICCDRASDHGGQGVLTISGVREAVAFVFFYDDENRDARLSAGDRLRLRVHPESPPADVPLFAEHDTAGRRMSVVHY